MTEIKSMVKQMLGMRYGTFAASEKSLKEKYTAKEDSSGYGTDYYDADGKKVANISSFDDEKLISDYNAKYWRVYNYDNDGNKSIFCLSSLDRKITDSEGNMYGLQLIDNGNGYVDEDDVIETLTAIKKDGEYQEVRERKTIREFLG